MMREESHEEEVERVRTLLLDFWADDGGTLSEKASSGPVWFWSRNKLDRIRFQNRTQRPAPYFFRNKVELSFLVKYDGTILISYS
jgi:hypothetical protein